MRERVLFLALLREWFKAIVYDGKREEYRALNPYWVKRLFEPTTEFAKKNWQMLFGRKLYDTNRVVFYESVKEALKTRCLRPKDFSEVEFCLGYPKKDDTERRKRYKLTGIKVGKGKREWGAPFNEVIIISFE